VPESDIEAISGNVLRLAQALMASYEGEAGTGALARTKALPELDKIVGRFRGHAKVLRKKQAPKLWGSLATGLGTIAAVAASSVADAQPYLGALKTFVALKQRSGDENGDEAEA
jgi:hypothetical protein